MITNKFAFIDLDETLVEGQSQLLFVKYLRSKGLLDFVSYLTLLFWFILYKLNLVRTPARALSFALKSFTGKENYEIERLAKSFFYNELQKKIYEKSFELIDNARRDGYTPVLVSAAIQPIVSVVATHFNIKAVICTQLDIVNRKITGKILGEPIYGSNKVPAVFEFLKKHKAQASECSAYADHFTDISLLEFVGHPYAVNPSKDLEVVAISRRWPIIYTNK